MEQYPKSEVGFQHPSRERGKCANCKHFEVLHHHGCERVQGTILPGDYCERFFLPISRIASKLKENRK
jgi:hypothetical protein